MKARRNDHPGPKHTPEPWTVDEHGGNFYVWGGRDGQDMIADNDNEEEFVPPEVVARMRGTGRGATDEEKRANAYVIAAAPKMLRTCKSVLAFFMSVRPSDPDDPLRAIQDRIHGPYREALEAVIAEALAPMEDPT